MANEFLDPVGHQPAITGLVAAALEKGRIVKITGNKTVGDAAATDIAFGVLVKETTAAGQQVAIQLLKYRYRFSSVAAETLAAGDFWKAGAASGAVQRVAKWIQGTDAESLKGGVVWSGGAANATVELLA